MHRWAAKLDRTIRRSGSTHFKQMTEREDGDFFRNFWQQPMTEILREFKGSLKQIVKIARGTASG
jgi:hypothetical protein